MRLLMLFVLMIGVSACGHWQSKRSAGGGSWDGYAQTGEASFYGAKHQGRRTASGEIFDASDDTAAHRRLPFGTKVRVTNLENGRSVVVEVNDRGPFVKGRVIDLSRSAFSKIASLSEGTVPVRLQVVD